MYLFVALYLQCTPLRLYPQNTVFQNHLKNFCPLHTVSFVFLEVIIFICFIYFHQLKTNIYYFLCVYMYCSLLSFLQGWHASYTLTYPAFHFYSHPGRPLYQFRDFSHSTFICIVFSYASPLMMDLWVVPGPLLE